MTIYGPTRRTVIRIVCAMLIFGGFCTVSRADEPADARESREALFGDDLAKPAASPWRGFVRGELAYTYADPEHWSKMLIRSELDAQGSLSENVKYKIGARL